MARGVCGCVCVCVRVCARAPLVAVDRTPHGSVLCGRVRVGLGVLWVAGLGDLGSAVTCTLYGVLCKKCNCDLCIVYSCILGPQ